MSINNKSRDTMYGFPRTTEQILDRLEKTTNPDNVSDFKRSDYEKFWDNQECTPNV